MKINLQFFGGRGASAGGSSAGGAFGLTLKSNAQVFNDISNLPNKIGSNQRWVLAREYEVQGPDGSVKRYTEFEGKDTYGSKNHDNAAMEGWKSTAALKTNYSLRTSLIGVGDTAAFDIDFVNGNVYGKVTKNNYKPVLVTIG